MRVLLVVFLLLPGCFGGNDVACGEGSWSNNALPVGVFASDFDEVVSHVSTLGYEFSDSVGEREVYREASNDDSRFFVRDGIRGIMLQKQSFADGDAPGSAFTQAQMNWWLDFMDADVDLQVSFEDNPKRRGWVQTWNDHTLDSTAGLLSADANGTTTLQMGSLREIPAVFETIDAEEVATAFAACSAEWHGEPRITGMSVVNDSIVYAALTTQGVGCSEYRHFFIDALTGSVAFEPLDCEV